MCRLPKTINFSPPSITGLMKMYTFIVFICLIFASLGSIHGAPQKDDLKFYLIKAGNLAINFTNFGARANSVFFPDKHGKSGDIILGFDNLKQMKADKMNFGAIPGRVANRIGYATFVLNGTRYKVPASEGRGYFSGGQLGYGYVFWKVAEIKRSPNHSHIIFTYKSYDGECGFPGDLDITVKHTVLPRRLITEITAKPLNKATPVNLGDHLVWNLGGHTSGDVFDHELNIFADKYVGFDLKTNLPTGKLVPVKGTGYDYRKPHIIANNAKLLKDAYSVNFALKNDSSLKFASIMHDKKSGRILKFYTTATNLHFCTSVKVKNVMGKGGYVYQPHAGFAFDGQDYPDAVNHPEFPSQIFTKGQVFKRKNVFELSVRA